MPDVRTGTVEFDLLRRVARPMPDLVGVALLLREGIDHSRLIQLAEVHGVRPSLATSFAALSWQAVPAECRASLETFERRHRLHTLALSGDLHRVAMWFGDNQIPFVTFKGPALALSLFGDLAQREYNDIDILVAEDQVDRAEDLLASLGYGSLQGARAFRRAFLSSQRQYALSRPDSGGSIDLHWDFCGTHVPFPLSLADAWNDRHVVSIGGREVSTVTGANLALLLAGHGTKESWRYLKWVRDFAWMIDRHRDLDWLDVHRRARENGSGDAILLGCSVVQELLDVAAPGVLAAPIARSARVRSRSSTLVRRMREGLEPSSLEESFADLDLCDGNLARLKGAVKLAIAPSAGDHAALELPQSLWPLYYVTRPLRLALRALARTQ